MLAKLTSHQFMKALGDKDASLFEMTLSPDCNWHTGQHFGILKGHAACKQHLERIFESFEGMLFLPRLTSWVEGSSTIEYFFGGPAVADYLLEPVIHDSQDPPRWMRRDEPLSEGTFGIFILDIDLEGLIFEIRNYYEDRTTDPAKTGRPNFPTVPLGTPNHRPIPTDPLDPEFAPFQPRSSPPTQPTEEAYDLITGLPLDSTMADSTMADSQGPQGATEAEGPQGPQAAE